MAEARVRGVITAEDRTRAGISSAQKNLRKLETSFDRIGRKATQVGKSLSTSVTLPLAGFGVLALRTAGNFEAAMNRVEVKAKEAGVSIEQLTEQAKELGSTTQFSATQAAQAQEVLATAGFDTARIYGSLPGVLSLAAAGGLELADAAGFTAVTLKAFNLEATQAQDVADLLAKGSLLANQSVSDLGNALRISANSGEAFGLTIEDTVAGLSVLAESATVAEEGGRALTNFLANIQSPASKARQQVEALGLTFNRTDGSLKPLNEILRILNEAQINAGNAAEFFGTKTLRTFQALDKGQGSLVSFNAELRDRTGVATEVAAANLEGLNGELTKLRSAFEGLQIAIADAGLLEFATEFVASITELTSRLSQTNPEILKTAVAIGAIVAAIGPAIIVFGQLALGVSALAGLPATFAAVGASLSGVGVAIAAISNPIGLTIAALAAIGLAVGAASDEFSEFFARVTRSAVRDLRDTFQPLLEGLVSFFNGALIPVVQRVAVVFGSILLGALRIVARVLRVTLGPLFQAIGFFLGTALPKAVSFLTGVFDRFAGFLSRVFEGLTNFIVGLLGAIGRLPIGVSDAANAAAKKLEDLNTSFQGTGEQVEETTQVVDNFGDVLDDATKDAAEKTKKNLDDVALRFKTLQEEIAAISETISSPAEIAQLQQIARLEKELEVLKKRRDDLVAEGTLADEKAPSISTAIDLSGVEEISVLDDGLRSTIGTLDELNAILGGPTLDAIAAVGIGLARSLGDAVDLFNQDSRSTWQIFESSAKSAINGVAQAIVEQLARKALASLLSLIPGVGPILGAIVASSSTAPVATDSASSSTAGPIVFQSLVPASTSDFIAASIGVQTADQRRTSFVAGGVGGVNVDPFRGGLF